MSAIPLPLPWARQLIANATAPVPDYGSPEWAALADTDPRKVAACVIAAECWRTYTDPAEIALRLRIELDANRARDDEPGHWTPEVVAEVHRTATRPSYAELCRRRREPEREQRARQHRQRLELVPSA